MASVSKRARKKADGTNGDKWVVRWVDVTGRQRQKAYPSKKAAEAHRLKLENERAMTGAIGFVEKRTIAQLVSDFSAATDDRFNEGRITRGTLRNVTTCLRVIERDWGKHLAADVQMAAVVEWYRRLKATGLGSNTARRRVETLRDVFAAAIRHGRARDNPAEKALEEIGGRVKVRIRTFSAEQVHDLLLAARTRRKWQHEQSARITEVFVHLAAFCGLRVGEILGLTLPMIDLDARVLRVRHTLDAWDTLTDPKTPASNRDVPIPAHIVAMLRAWIDDRYVDNARQIVFRGMTTRKGAFGPPIRAASFRDNYWRKLLDSAGMYDHDDAYHFHALRHFAGSWWLSQGVPVPDVAKLMGHADAKVTMGIYAHALLTTDQRTSAVDHAAAALMNTQPIQLAHLVHTDEKPQ